MLSARLRPITAIPTTPICCLDIGNSCLRDDTCEDSPHSTCVAAMLTQLAVNGIAIDAIDVSSVQKVYAYVC